MKTIIKLSIIIFILGCADGDKKESIISNNIEQIDSLQTEQLIDREFAISERNIGYGNDGYIIRTTPFIDSITNKYTVEILLKGKSDTVYLKSINKDTLLKYVEVLINLAKEKEVPFRDTIDIEEFKEYNLVDVVSTSGIRGYNSYLIAKFTKSSSKDIFVSFQIKAFPYHGKVGRMWVSILGYNDKSFNYSKEQIIKAHNRVDG